MKRCADCGKTEEETPFYRSKLSYCKTCHAIRRKQWKKNNLTKVKESHKKYYVKNSDKVKSTHRRYRLARGYRVSPDEYDIMFEQQGGACKICNRPTIERLAVDHCHATGRIRGLLCRHCNLGLGQFRDDISSLTNAILYLKSLDES